MNSIQFENIKADRAVAKGGDINRAVDSRATPTHNISSNIHQDDKSTHLSQNKPEIKTRESQASNLARHQS